MRAVLPLHNAASHYGQSINPSVVNSSESYLMNINPSFRIILTIITILYSFLVSAADAPRMLIACNVSAESYPEIKNTLFRKEITLTGSQLSQEGKKLIGKIRPYEFWVETNMLSLNEPVQILDFVLVMKNTKTNISHFALSGRHAINDGLMMAKLRSVAYKKEGVHEHGTLEFSCLTQDVPTKPVFDVNR